MSNVDFDSIEIRHRKMKDVLETARAAAISPANTLIIGAAGTGKTSLARWIHRLGRSGRPFLSLSLKEHRDRTFDVAAVFRSCAEGTLLLEEIDMISASSQAQLFEALEKFPENERPRLISTSRRELRSLARQDLFRQDLYYRLTVLTLEVPTLEQRTEDLPILSRFLLEVSGILHGKSHLKLSPGAEQKLMDWSWPGNLRELENVIERAVALSATEQIEADQIVFDPEEPQIVADFGPGMSLSEVERRLILQTLELTAQNRTRAAQLLGISIRTLRNKLNEYREAGAI